MGHIIITHKIRISDTFKSEALAACAGASSPPKAWVWVCVVGDLAGGGERVSGPGAPLVGFFLTGIARDTPRPRDPESWRRSLIHLFT